MLKINTSCCEAMQQFLEIFIVNTLQNLNMTMKDLFSWKLPISESEIEDLWENAIFVFDTNFLLSFYEVSYSTYQDYKIILNAVKSRVWIPYQVADEFLFLREGTIKREKESLTKIKGALNNWYEKQRVFQDFGLIKDGKIARAELEEVYESQEMFHLELEKLFKELQNKLRIKTEESKHLEMDIERDEVMNFIFELFDEKIGSNFDNEFLKNLHKEGEDRFLRNQPPGFKDTNKKYGIQKYGDLILWKQILEFSKDSHSIIFITNDGKEDWWNIGSSGNKSPHFELRREFKTSVNKLFWMYSGDDFIKKVTKRLNVRASEKSIRESEEISKSEELSEDSSLTFEEIIQTDNKALYPMNALTSSPALDAMIQQYGESFKEMSALTSSPDFKAIIQQHNEALKRMAVITSSPDFKKEMQKISDTINKFTSGYKYPNS